MNTIQEIEKKYQKQEIPEFRIGDVVDVHIKLKEGEKERIQTFTGTVIGRKGSGLRENFTVRRIVAGEGVERVFPIHSPAISGLAVKRPGRARRAKLYYLRERVGKSTKTKERREEEVAGSETASAKESKKRTEPVSAK
jgi:large subunit ribosomal protein L19